MQYLFLLPIALIALVPSHVSACSTRSNNRREHQQILKKTDSDGAVQFDDDSNATASQALNASASDHTATLVRPFMVTSTVTPLTIDHPSGMPFQEHSTLLVRDYVKFTTKSTHARPHPAYDMTGHPGATPPRHMIHRLLPFYQPPPQFRSLHPPDDSGSHLPAASNGDYVVEYPDNAINDHRSNSYSPLSESKIIYYGDNVEYKKPTETSTAQPVFSYVHDDGHRRGKLQRRYGTNSRGEKCICKDDEDNEVDAMATGYIPMLTPPEMKVDQIFERRPEKSRSKCAHESILSALKPETRDREAETLNESDTNAINVEEEKKSDEKEKSQLNEPDAELLSHHGRNDKMRPSAAGNAKVSRELT